MPAQGRAGSEPPSGPNTDGVVALSPSYGENKEYITVCRSDIRKEMQCPICLGIIRKTRTVMECLHRFCRECIDKSMRLGNNECPACRTHCASRRSLRDDPNFDALVAAIYPDLDKYEEEELALFEDEARVNRQIQENIADTFKRQSEAIARRRTTAKATAAAIVRKAHGNFRSVQSRQRGRGRGRQGGRRSRYSEGSARYEDDDSYDNEKAETATSGDDTQSESAPERKRRRSKVQVSGYTTGEENSENESLSARTHDRHEVPATFGTEKMAIGSMERESDGDVSPTNHEGTLKSWAKGTRSSRYGSVNGIPGTNGNSRNGRTLPRTKELIDALMAASHTENEFVVHLSLQPLNDESDEEDNISSLTRPHLCCPPSMTVHHLCKYLSTCLTTPPETELEILVESKSEQFSIPKPPPRLSKLSKGKSWASRADGGKEVMLLSSGHTLESVLCDFWDYNGNLELLYRRKSSILSN